MAQGLHGISRARDYIYRCVCLRLSLYVHVYVVTFLCVCSTHKHTDERYHMSDKASPNDTYLRDLHCHVSSTPSHDHCAPLHSSRTLNWASHTCSPDIRSPASTLHVSAGQVTQQATGRSSGHVSDSSVSRSQARSTRPCQLPKTAPH